MLQLTERRLPPVRADASHKKGKEIIISLSRGRLRAKSLKYYFSALQLYGNN